MRQCAQACSVSRQLSSVLIPSVHSCAACSDWSAPPLDLALDKFAQIFWASSFESGNLLTNRRKAISHRRGVERFTDRPAESLDNRCRRVLRQENGLPGNHIELQALLLCSWHLRQGRCTPWSRGGQHLAKFPSICGSEVEGESHI